MNPFLKKWAPRLLVILAILFLLSELGQSAWFFLQHDWKAVNFRYPLDYGEGPLLDQTLRLARFENIYHQDLSRPPYTIANYPPLFLLLQVPFAWLSGPAFWYGRAISFLSILLAALFAGLALHATTKNRLAGLVGGLTLLAFPYIVFWSPLNRVDSLALGVSMAGLFATTRWSGSRKGLIAAAILLTASIYAKQSYALAAPLAAFVWLLREKPRRRAFELAAWVAGPGLALFLLLTILTGGGFFTNVITANVNPFFWRTVQNSFDKIREHIALLSLGAIAFIAIGWRSKSSATAWWMVAPYLVGATLSGITIGKTGSNINYLMEFSAALGLAAGALVAWTARSRWQQVIVLLLLAFQVNSLIQWNKNDPQGWDHKKYDQVAEIEQMIQLTQQAQGLVLADEYMGVVPLAGKSLYFQPFEFKQLSTAGLWDEQPFLDDILKGKFAAIILYDPSGWDSRKERWTPMQLAAISISYKSGTKLADAIVLVPKNK
jgi:4-amino-4-deoxy-L-arabinose transferase-like glycosyltransferase